MASIVTKRGINKIKKPFKTKLVLYYDNMHPYESPDIREFQLWSQMGSGAFVLDMVLSRNREKKKIMSFNLELLLKEKYSYY